MLASMGNVQHLHDDDTTAFLGLPLAFLMSLSSYARANTICRHPDVFNELERQKPMLGQRPATLHRRNGVTSTSNTSQPTALKVFLHVKQSSTIAGYHSNVSCASTSE